MGWPHLGIVFINPHVCVCVCVSALHRTRPQTPSEQWISPTKTCSGSPSPRGRGIKPWCRPQQTCPQTTWHTGPAHSHHQPSLTQNGYVFSLFCLLSVCVENASCLDSPYLRLVLHCSFSLIHLDHPHTRIHACMHTHTCKCMHTHTHACTHTHTHACTHTHTCMHTHTHTHTTYKHTHMHVHMHAHTHTHTHTHTHSLQIHALLVLAGKMRIKKKQISMQRRIGWFSFLTF